MLPVTRGGVSLGRVRGNVGASESRSVAISTAALGSEGESFRRVPAREASRYFLWRAEPAVISFGSWLFGLVLAVGFVVVFCYVVLFARFMFFLI